MNNLDKAFKVNVNLSKSGEYLILSDDRKQKMIVNVNLVKHCLEIPYTKKDGTLKTVGEIQIDKINAKIKYIDAVTKNEIEEPEEVKS